jgi:hypothetical protein
MAQRKANYGNNRQTNCMRFEYLQWKPHEKEIDMRTLPLIAIACMTIALAGGSARAADDSAQFCAYHADDEGVICGFASLSECQATLHDDGGYCSGQ